MHRRRVTALVAAGVVVSTGCGSSRPLDDAAKSTPVAQRTVGCESIVLGTSGAGGSGMRRHMVGSASFALDPPTIPYSPRARSLALRGHHVWKAPVGVSAGDSIVVEVHPSQRDRVRLQFARGDHRRGFSRLPMSVRFDACDAGATTRSGPVGDESGFAGAIVTKRRQECVRLLLTNGDGDRREVILSLEAKPPC